MTFIIAVSSAWLYQWRSTRKWSNQRLRVLIYAMLCGAILVLVFQLYLPSVSEDARYLKTVYERVSFRIHLKDYLLFLSLPVLYLVAALFFKRKPSGSDNRETLWILAGTTLFCVIMTSSYLFTNRIVQPAHWSRVYPYVFIIIIGTICAGRGRAVLPTRATMPFTLGLLAAALVDSTLGVRYIWEAFRSQRRPPLFLTPDQAHLVEQGKQIPPGRFLYLRGCANRQVVGDFEYAMMAMSPQKSFFGHVYFSPLLPSVRSSLFPCRHHFRTPASLLRQTDYLVLDRPLFDKLASFGGKILYKGEELVAIRSERKRRMRTPARQRNAK
jgi:hypothetical protein